MSSTSLSDTAPDGVAEPDMTGLLLQAGTTTVTLSGSGYYSLASGQTISVKGGGGIITNDGATLDIAGVVAGYPFGIDALASLNLRNIGTIIGNGQYSDGEPGAVESGGPAYISNAGLIKSLAFGVSIAGVGTIVNNGTITGATAVKLAGGGSVDNTGYVLGTSGSAIWLTDGGSATNSGTLISKHAGGGGIVIIGRAGTFDNEAGGLVEGDGVIAVGIRSGGTFINAGTVTSNTGVAVRLGGGDVTLFDLPGAVFNGAVLAYVENNDINTMDLGAGSAGAVGTVAVPGSFTGFTILNVETGADWKLGNAATSTLMPGITTVNDFGTLALHDVTAGVSINLENAASVLALNGTGTASFAGIISGLELGGQIDLGGSFLPTPPNAGDISLSFNAATGLLSINDTVSGKVHSDTLTFSNGLAGTFHAAVDGNGIVITEVACFAAGTRILTPDGDVPVEALAVGDEVLTLRGKGDAIGRVIWTGQRSIDLVRHSRPEKVIPIRIIAGALTAGLPERDLLLSPDHCLFIDGHLIEAKTLVNGATIIQDETLRHITYHHIELEQHGIVLAEGVPAETYLDSHNRQMFAGGAALVLHPDFGPQTRADACAKLAITGTIVHAARQRLLDRALALGFTVTRESDLMVKAGQNILQPKPTSQPNCVMFDLSEPCSHLDLLCSAGVPAHTSADPADRRRLGAAITALTLHSGTQSINISLTDPAHIGLHTPEPTHTWTTGNTRIALPAHTGPATIELRLLGQAPRWHNAAKRGRDATG
jgi:hypothetical protein